MPPHVETESKIVSPKSRASDSLLEELLAFERLLSDLSARFANVASDRVVAEIETALRQLLGFLGFGRGTIGEFDDEGNLSVLCSAAVKGLEPNLRGPMPAYRKWFETELLAGRTVAIRSYRDFPPEAAEAAEHYRQVGIRSQLVIPLAVGGSIVAMIAFVAFQPNREWPDEFVARIKVIGEVMAQALIRTRSEDALRATQSELARVSGLTAAGRAAASIAHEINQPLSAVVTNGSAALRWLSNPAPDIREVRTALERIVKEGNRASQIIVGIRSMFKNVSQHTTSLDLNRLIHEVLKLMDPELRRNQVLVQIELIREPLKVIADRIQLQQVVANLITNAIDAMSVVNDRARILRIKSAVSKPDSVSISVDDSGPGIDRENLRRIFNPFFTTKPQGLGMGLAICQSIIESHGGSLSALPGYPHGAVFHIILPTIMIDGA